MHDSWPFRLQSVAPHTNDMPHADACTSARHGGSGAAGPAGTKHMADTLQTHDLKDLSPCGFLGSQVRAAQLEKEAGELREENGSLHEQVEALRASAASAVQVDAW